MNYQEALDWLYSTQMFGIKLGLDPTRRLLEALDAMPRPGQTVFHVAGTNGKGSVCTFLDSISRAHGLRTGLFTSPHLVRYNERIQIDGQQIADADVAEILTRLRSLVADWETHPTFFELTTALAMHHFTRNQARVIVLETGMGGRLDSTNAVPSNISLLTQIDWDHQKWLGDTLEKIGAEKAGIMKPGVPAVSLPQTPGVLEVFRNRAEAVGAPLEILPEPLEGYELGLAGSHQKENAGLAVLGWQKSGLPLDSPALARGLREARLPARFDRVGNGRFLIDGAHNPASTLKLVETWRSEIGAEKRPLVIYGSLRDKELRKMLPLLEEIAGAFVPVEVRSARALDRGTLAAAMQQTLRSPELIVDQAIPLPELLQTAEDPRRLKAWLPEHLRAASQDCPVLIAGSFFLAGEALAQLSAPRARVRATVQ